MNVPALEVSGDFFDFFRRDDGLIYFNLADVSGKGMTLEPITLLLEEILKIDSLENCHVLNFSSNWILIPYKGEKELAIKDRFYKSLSKFCSRSQQKNTPALIYFDKNTPQLQDTWVQSLEDDLVKKAIIIKKSSKVS